MGDLEVIHVRRIVSQPQSLTARLCLHEIWWRAVWKRLGASQNGPSLTLWAAPLLGMEAKNGGRDEGFQPWGEAGKWEQERSSADEAHLFPNFVQSEKSREERVGPRCESGKSDGELIGSAKNR